MMFRMVISFIYEKFLFVDRVPLRVCSHVLRRLYNSLVVRALTTDCTLYSLENWIRNERKTEKQKNRKTEKQNFDL